MLGVTDTVADHASGAAFESRRRADDLLPLEVSSKNRLTELDALRGLAALAVFWSHAFGMLASTPPLLKAIQYTPLRVLYDGTVAVLLFFVLSGFVLNLKYVDPENRKGRWAAVFVIRRIFRIYPACLASLCLASVLRMYAFDPALTTNFSSWFQKVWETPVDWSNMLYSGNSRSSRGPSRTTKWSTLVLGI